MRAHGRTIDRMIPADVAGYPVNYGFVSQTVSYAGDPFDALILGPPVSGGRLVSAVVVGVMWMEDEKGLHSKGGAVAYRWQRTPLHTLTTDVQREIGDFSRPYRQHEAAGCPRCRAGAPSRKVWRTSP